MDHMSWIDTDAEDRVLLKSTYRKKAESIGNNQTNLASTIFPHKFTIYAKRLTTIGIVDQYLELQNERYRSP